MNKILKDIRTNIYLYIAIVAVCVIASSVFTFVVGEGSYVGKTNIYGADGTSIVTITVNTDDEKSNSKLLNSLTNEAITEIHNQLSTSVNKSSNVTKKVDYTYSVVRGLFIGLVLCVITSLNALLPKKKIKSEDEISEIFDGAPIIAKFSDKINEGKQR